ncbi:hypothetical protein SD427_01935 [Chryseobacterium sp. JJR-5R]|uniref:hypothetical protein n=1 Tax=Chryseobacterium sp. JJR-5R TaxID=3093923 RepID=UPI002A764933|nr:hypothetical protein [Chryseobacterium sp. JJR-5R]WPO83123.1 hypothetical protein SD427_01935 [Chryseobacterium sp. JJR-5R]
MKKINLTKLSRQALKDITGGDLYPALECYSNIECSRYGEALIMCPDGTSSMTNYSCLGGKCVMNAGSCPPVGIAGPVQAP